MICQDLGYPPHPRHHPRDRSVFEHPSVRRPTFAVGIGSSSRSRRSRSWRVSPPRPSPFLESKQAIAAAAKSRNWRQWTEGESDMLLSLEGRLAYKEENKGWFEIW